MRSQNQIINVAHISIKQFVDIHFMPFCNARIIAEISAVELRHVSKINFILFTSFFFACKTKGLSQGFAHLLTTHCSNLV